MVKWVYERDLEVDLLATQSGRGRQVRDLRKRAVELSSRLDQRRGLFQQLKGMEVTRSRLNP
jgi:hypothetical protein